MKDANFHTFNKDKEIEKLVKENERLKAENATYKELLSPEIVHQRSLKSREIATTAKASSYNQGGFDAANPENQPARPDPDTHSNPDTAAFEHPANSNENGDERYPNDKREELYSDWASDISELSDEFPRQPPPGTRERKARYCHFYNRNGCNTPNCSFIHDVAPICGEYEKGQCRRKLCQFTHEKRENFWDSSADKPPDQQQQKGNAQGSKNPWIQIGGEKTHQMQPLYSERRLPHHRYRYKTDSQQNQMQQDFPANYQNNSNNLTSYQSYPHMRR